MFTFVRISRPAVIVPLVAKGKGGDPVYRVLRDSNFPFSLLKWSGGTAVPDCDKFPTRRGW